MNEIGSKLIRNKCGSLENADEAIYRQEEKLCDGEDKASVQNSSVDPKAPSQQAPAEARRYITETDKRLIRFLVDTYGYSSYDVHQLSQYSEHASSKVKIPEIHSSIIATLPYLSLKDIKSILSKAGRETTLSNKTNYSFLYNPNNTPMINDTTGSNKKLTVGIDPTQILFEKNLILQVVNQLKTDYYQHHPNQVSCYTLYHMIAESDLVEMIYTTGKSLILPSHHSSSKTMLVAGNNLTPQEVMTWSNRWSRYLTIELYQKIDWEEVYRRQLLLLEEEDEGEVDGQQQLMDEEEDGIEVNEKAALKMAENKKKMKDNRNSQCSKQSATNTTPSSSAQRTLSSSTKQQQQLVPVSMPTVRFQLPDEQDYKNDDDSDSIDTVDEYDNQQQSRNRKRKKAESSSAVPSSQGRKAVVASTSSKKKKTGSKSNRNSNKNAAMDAEFVPTTENEEILRHLYTEGIMTIEQLLDFYPLPMEQLLEILGPTNLQKYPPSLSFVNKNKDKKKSKASLADDENQVQPDQPSHDTSSRSSATRPPSNDREARDMLALVLDYLQDKSSGSIFAHHQPFLQQFQDVIQEMDLIRLESLPPSLQAYSTATGTDDDVEVTATPSSSIIFQTTTTDQPDSLVVTAAVQTPAAEVAEDEHGDEEDSRSEEDADIVIDDLDEMKDKEDEDDDDTRGFKEKSERLQVLEDIITFALQQQDDDVVKEGTTKSKREAEEEGNDNHSVAMSIMERNIDHLLAAANVLSSSQHNCQNQQAD